MKLTRYQYPVRITWARHPRWNLICAWCIEHLGLPGDRYITDVQEDHMQWYFLAREDQLLFTLAWGDDSEQ